MKQSATFLSLAAIALLSGLFGLVRLRGRGASTESFGRVTDSGAVPSATTAPQPVARVAPAVSTLATPSASAVNPGSAAMPLDEKGLMSTLRALRSTNPELSLQLAREGNARFKAGPDTAERSWVIVKALSDLGRHDEARVEGRSLLEHYRNTRWAEDVYRHLFVNPGTHPFERGYGKELELE